jgi:hypothetical protein
MSKEALNGFFLQKNGYLCVQGAYIGDELEIIRF